MSIAQTCFGRSTVKPRSNRITATRLINTHAKARHLVHDPG
jgi:hypothetical protein